MKKFILAISVVVVLGLAACGSSNNNGDDDNGYGNGNVYTGNDTQQGSNGYETLDPRDEVNEQDWGSYTVVINGAGFQMPVFTPHGMDVPTHVEFGVFYALGLETMSAGSQMAVIRDGESVAELEIVNYLVEGYHRIAVDTHDTFMGDNFAVYVPLSLFNELGFDVHTEEGRVLITG